jgi:hypothetical protein
MKAKFNYGDGKKDFIVLEVPNEYKYIERLTYISCDAQYSDKGDSQIYRETSDKFLKDVVKLFCKNMGIKVKKGLTAEFGVLKGGYELVFDIVQYPTK